jgi:hypothetical protein
VPGLQQHPDVDHERLAEDLEDLARFRQLAAWQRRVRQLGAQMTGSPRAWLFHRRRLIRDAMLLNPTWNQRTAAQWVDGLVPRTPTH